MRVCAVESCKNSSKNGKQCFAFPNDVNRCSIWLKNSQLESHGKWSTVCEDHFAEDSFIFTITGKRRLRNTANPTVFKKPNLYIPETDADLVFTKSILKKNVPQDLKNNESRALSILSFKPVIIPSTSKCVKLFFESTGKENVQHSKVPSACSIHKDTVKISKEAGYSESRNSNENIDFAENVHTQAESAIGSCDLQNKGPCAAGASGYGTDTNGDRSSDIVLTKSSESSTSKKDMIHSSYTEEVLVQSTSQECTESLISQPVCEGSRDGNVDLGSNIILTTSIESKDIIDPTFTPEFLVRSSHKCTEDVTPQSNSVDIPSTIAANDKDYEQIIADLQRKLKDVEQHGKQMEHYCEQMQRENRKKDRVIKLLKTQHKKYSTELQNKVKKLQQEVRINDSLSARLSSFVNEDQVRILTGESKKVQKWENNTMLKAYRLRLSCGLAGYNEVKKSMPLPAERTLNRRVKGFKFDTGI
ncbi:uncharacterized protein LOC117167991 isoform X2 [Belonocnema kinseyi]|uniref:uncharacterized protein LOC117167991 isoform X2 n=1 Tax=Belonocnema kinseyi TaxID=2817044 RepID=UPI00143E0CED|nr:uncharacterized protein LOC117167991 isoform X2 [Belonocnema kinseyi]